MVAAIAADSGIRMPSFFGYLLRAAAILVPRLYSGCIECASQVRHCPRHLEPLK
jgi:hypothetical protein